MPFDGNERQRRRLAHDGPGRELVRRRVGEAAELGQQPLRLVERMHDEARQDLRTHRMEPELEGGDDAEIAAAAAQSPKEVRVLGVAGAHKLPVGGDDVGRDEIVDRQSEFARGPAEAAAERQAGDAGRRVDAGRRRKAEFLRLAVEVGERRAGHRPEPCASPGRRRTDFISERSMRRPPSQTALPAMLWPPPRTATSSFSSRASLTACMTSSRG